MSSPRNKLRKPFPGSAVRPGAGEPIPPSIVPSIPPSIPPSVLPSAINAESIVQESLPERTVCPEDVLPIPPPLLHPIKTTVRDSLAGSTACSEDGPHFPSSNRTTLRESFGGSTVCSENGLPIPPPTKKKLRKPFPRSSMSSDDGIPTPPTAQTTLQQSLARSLIASDDGLPLPPPPTFRGPHGTLSSSATIVDSSSDISPTPDLEKGSLSNESRASSEQRTEELSRLVTQVKETPSYSDPDGRMLKRSKEIMTLVKIFTMGSILTLNAFMIFASWWWSHLYYIFIPFIAFGVAVSDVVVLTLVLWKIKHLILPERKLPASPKDESLILIVPCYNESEQELRQSLDSLAAQRNIADHPVGIVIVCDGRVRGPGMTQTAADCLLHNILTEKTLSVHIPRAYLGWDKHPSGIILQRGTYKNVPYLCIVKMENAGKRDSLILVRSFAYNFNLRHLKRQTILSPRLFGEMASFLLDDCGMNNVHAIVGLDADTILDSNCIYELMKELRYPKTVGVCGVVEVDFRAGSWNVWRLMQHAAYTISQGMPRLHQSTVTKKVTCLPGCCQVLKVCEETCSDDILREKFGYHPKPSDTILKHLRANYSEDRNHVVNVLTSRPHVQTRQALKAKAYTDVPISLSVFLSQRKRWSLGATTNDYFLLTTRGTYWFERIRALANVLTWFINIFILGSLAGLIVSAKHAPWYFTVGFLGAVIVLFIYMFFLVFWFPPTPKAKLQYLVGLAIYMFVGPFMTILVLLYALYHLDHFSWGKTRQVILDDPVGTNDGVNNNTRGSVNSDRSSVTLPPTATNAV